MATNGQQQQSALRRTVFGDQLHQHAASRLQERFPRLLPQTSHTFVQSKYESLLSVRKDCTESN